MSTSVPTSPGNLLAWVHPRTPLGRARLILLVGLILLTAAAWNDWPRLGGMLPAISP